MAKVSSVCTPENGVPVAGGQKTTIPTFMVNREGGNECLHPSIRWTKITVFATGWRPLPQGQPRCRTIHSNNLCPLDSFSPCFLTPSILLPMQRSRHSFLSPDRVLAQVF